MVALTHFTIAASFLGTAWSLPFECHVVSTTSLVVHQIPKGTRANGPASYLKALKKHGGSSGAIATVGKVVASSVTATPVSNDLEYLCPIIVGSQTFKMDFDTGSSDLWILGQSLAGKVSSGHTLYKPGKTAVLQKGQTWDITYGDGSSAKGNVYADTVTIGSTVIKGQEVERASTASGSFLDGASDGLLGLAFNALNTVSPTQASTWFSTAAKQGLPALFTADLKKGAPGSYQFGAISTSSYSGSIGYATVDSSEGFWMFTPSSYSIGTGSTVNGAPLTGIADTGTTLMLLDSNIVAAYWAQVQGAVNDPNSGGWIFPCTATLPSFTLNIGTYQAIVPGTYMNYAQAGGSNTCFGGLQSDAGIGFAVYGDIFLKSQFVIFDNTAQGPRLGFANKA